MLYEAPNTFSKIKCSRDAIQTQIQGISEVIGAKRHTTVHWLQFCLPKQSQYASCVTVHPQSSHVSAWCYSSDDFLCVVKTSINVTNNSPSQDCSHADDLFSSSFDCIKSFAVLFDWFSKFWSSLRLLE